MGNYVASAVTSKATELKDYQLRQAALQREAMLAIQLARTRDQFQYGSVLYAGIVTGAAANFVHTRTVPIVFRVPIVLGGFVLTYLWDMSYGTKMIRIVKEAEHILDNDFERLKLVPPQQLPFYKFYTVKATTGTSVNETASVRQEEVCDIDSDAARQSQAKVARVGKYWPGFVRSLLEK